MVKDAQQHGKTDLDVVFIGDSIIERWNGTKGLGNVMLPDFRAVFTKKFTKAGGGSFEGLALGSGGDTVRLNQWNFSMEYRAFVSWLTSIWPASHCIFYPIVYRLGTQLALAFATWNDGTSASQSLAHLDWIE
jgi:hypothetical protein